MANQERGEVDLAARGQTYTLVLSTNGACALEAASGKTVEAIFQGAIQRRVLDMRWMIWGCLQEKHAAEILTPLDAGTFIDDAGGLAIVWNALNGFATLNADPRPPDPSEGTGAAVDPPIAQDAARGNGSISMPAASA